MSENISGEGSSSDPTKTVADALEKAVQTAFRSVADALTARATYEDQTAAAARLVKAQRRRFELAQLRYKTGADSYLTLLTAQTDLYSAELSLSKGSKDEATRLFRQAVSDCSHDVVEWSAANDELKALGAAR